MKWSPDGTNVIIVTQAIHDTTGSTYYGQTALWLYSFGFKKLIQIPTLDVFNFLFFFMIAKVVRLLMIDILFDWFLIGSCP